MKKIVLLAAALFLTSCAPSGSTAFNEEQFLKEIRPNAEVLNSCLQETFGADVDYDTSYLSAYTDEAAYDNGNGERAVLFPPEEEAEYAKSYFIDPTYSELYPVSNFKTNEDVRNYLRGYMSDGVIDEYFRDDFFEYEGTLYLRRGARGYGAVSVDLDSLKYLEEKDGAQYVSADFLIFDEYDYTAKLEFVKDKDKWILNKVETPEADGFNEEDFINEVRPNIEALNSCLTQTYGADVDYDTAYLSAYTDEAAYDNGNGERAVLFPAEEEAEYAKSYFIDPARWQFYPVSNFKTNEDVRDYLRGYMSDEVIDKYFYDDFFEFDKLYLVRGDRDYPDVSIDMDNIKYLEEKDGAQYVSVDILFFGEYNQSLKLELVKNDGQWIINNVAY